MFLHGSRVNMHGSILTSSPSQAQQECFRDSISAICLFGQPTFSYSKCSKSFLFTVHSITLVCAISLYFRCCGE